MQLIYNGSAVPLPDADPDAMQMVSVWAVPVDYMPSGFFIDARSPRELQQVPACAGSDALLLAELTLSSEGADVQYLAEGVTVE